MQAGTITSHPRLTKTQWALRRCGARRRPAWFWRLVSQRQSVPAFHRVHVPAARVVPTDGDYMLMMDGLGCS